MNRRFIRDLVFILGLMCLPGIAPAFASRSETVPSYMPMLSDFNGDNQVDQVTLSSEGLHKHIHIRLGLSISRSLHFDTAVDERGRLYYGDFDNDGDIDLLWSSQTYPRRVVMWEGDGHGNFSMSNSDDADRFRCAFADDAPSRMIDDDDAPNLACLLSTFFCGCSPQALTHLKPPSLETGCGLERTLSPTAFGVSLSTERGPPQIHSFNGFSN
jgi:hypothetical protein